MKIVANGNEYPIVQIVNRNEHINSAFREVAEIQTAEPITPEMLADLQTGWSLEEADMSCYSEPVRHSVWMGKVSVSEEELAAKEAELAAALAVTDKFVSAIPSLVEGKPAELALQFWHYFPDWTEGNWSVGQNLKHNNYPFKVFQAHNSTGIPNWNPTEAPALFSPWHGTTAETALDFRPVTGGHDIYKAGEWMIWTDGVKYKCLQDTAYSPTDYPPAWEAQPSA